MPLCWPSTQTSQATVANIGKAISCLNVTIHAPGRGRARARPGSALSARYGSAMPTPIAPNTASACSAGKPTAYPSDAPMNGAVQGDAIAVASTPDKNAFTPGFFDCRFMARLGKIAPNSNSPARFSPSSVNSAASAATTAGLCN